MAAKIRTRLCARCKKQQRTGNAYCQACDALRKAEARGRVSEPETEKGREVRGLVDKTFALLEAGGEGTEVNVKGISVTNSGDDTVTFKLNSRQHERLAEIERSLAGGL